jgi:hypothetical protein
MEHENHYSLNVHERGATSGEGVPSIQDILENLKEAGISDLEGFIKAELERAKARVSAERPASPLGPPVSALPTEGTQEHRVPEFPVRIDGVLYDPKDIKRFNGHILHFIAPTGVSPVFQAYTGNQWPEILRTYIQFRNASAALSNSLVVNLLHTSGLVGWGGNNPPGGGAGVGPGGAAAAVSYPPSRFFSDINYEGDWFWLDQGRQYPDLFQVYHGSIFSSSSFNDEISSVKPNLNGITVLYDDLNISGSSLTIPLYTPDLRPFGWNDRASSVVVY